MNAARRAMLALSLLLIAAPSFPAPASPTIWATLADAIPVRPSGRAEAGDTLTYTAVVGNSGSGDASDVHFGATLDANTTLVAGSLKVSPLALDDAYAVLGNVAVTIDAAAGLLANDSDPDASGTLQVDTASVARSGGSLTGSLTVNADGSFTYTPPTGETGDETFTYQVVDEGGAGLTSNEAATVTFTVPDMLWFIDNSAGSAGDGSLSAPFESLAAFSAANDGAAGHPGDGATIFVVGTGTDYSGEVDLRDGQRLFGSGMSVDLATAAGVTAPPGATLPSTGGTAPVLTHPGAGNDAVLLGADNTLRGLSIGDTGGAGIYGDTFGTLTVAEVSIGGSGQALDLVTGTLAATFSALASTNSEAAGLAIFDVAGSLTVAGTTTITTPQGPGICVDGTAATLTMTFSGMTTLDTGNASEGVLVGSIEDTQATLRFNGLDIETVDGTGVDWVGPGEFDAAGGAVTVDTDDGVGLWISCSPSGGPNALFGDSLSVHTGDAPAAIFDTSTLSVAAGPGTAELISTGEAGLVIYDCDIAGPGFAIDTVESGGGTDGIRLELVTGDILVGSAILSGHTDDSLSIEDFDGTLTIPELDIDPSADVSVDAAVDIDGVLGTINLGTGGAGLDIDGGGGDGVEIDASGTINLGTGAGGSVAIDGVADTAIQVAGDATVNVATGGGTGSIGATTDPGEGIALDGSGVFNCDATVAIESNVPTVFIGGAATDTTTATFGGTITSSGSTGGPPLYFADADGSYTFSAMVTASVAGPVPALLGDDDASGTIHFTGDLDLTSTTSSCVNLYLFPGTFQVDGTATLQSGGPGLYLRRATGTATFAELDIDSGGAQRGIDLRESDVALSVDGGSITGDGTAGSIGIDLSGSTNPNGANATTPNLLIGADAGESFETTNVETGVLMGNASHGSAGAYLRYGNQTEPDSGSSIDVAAGGTTLDTSNLTSTDPYTQGRYEFAGVTFGSGDRASFESSSGSYYFVASTATGTGDGSNAANRASPATFLASLGSNSLANTTVLLINDGSPIDLGANSAELNAGTVLDGFGNGNSITAFAVPVNVIVTEANLTNQTSITDPTGNGAATLLSSNATATVQVADGNTISNIKIDNSGGWTLRGDGFTDLLVDGVELSPIVGFRGPLLSNAHGTVTLRNLTSKRELFILGGDAVVEISKGTGSSLTTNDLRISDTTGGSVTITGLALTGNGTFNAASLSNNVAPVTLTDLTVTYIALGTGIGIDGSDPSTGAITVNGSSSIDNVGGTAISIGAGARDIDLATVNLTGDGAGDPVVEIDGQSGGTIDLGSLQNDGTTANSVIQVTNQSGGTLNVGDTDITGFGNNAADTAIKIQGTGGTVDFADLDVVTSNGRGVLMEAQTVDFGASPTIDATGGTGLSLTGTTLTGTQTFGDITVTAPATNGLALSNVTGTLDVQSGALSAGGIAVQVSGGAPTFTYSGNITNTAGRSLVVSATTGGSVTMDGASLTDSGTGILIDSVAGDVTVDFDSATLTGSDGVDIASTTADLTGTVRLDDLHVDNLTAGYAMFIGENGSSKISGTLDFNNVDLTQTSGGTGHVLAVLDCENATIDFDATSTIETSGAGRAGPYLFGFSGTNTVSHHGTIVAGTAAERLGGGTGLQITGADGTAFSFADLEIYTTGQIGLDCRGGGTLTVTDADADNVIDTLGTTALLVSDTDVAAGGLTFATVNRPSAASNGIVLEDIGSGPVAIGAGQITAGNTGIAFSVDGGSGTIDYGGSLASAGVATTLVVRDRTGGTVTVGDDPSDIIDEEGSGLSLLNNSGGSVVLRATLDVDIASGNGVDISGGVLEIAGDNNTIDAGTGLGIDATNATLRLTGSGLDVATTSGRAVSCSSGSLAIEGQNLRAATDSGYGYYLNGAAAFTLTGSGHTVDANTGRAIRINDTPIGAGGVSFESVSTTAALEGAITLSNSGTGPFTVGTDDGGEVIGDGGHIQATGSDAVSLTNAANVTLRNLIIGANAAAVGAPKTTTSVIGGDGIALDNVDNVTLERLKIARTADHGVRGTSVSGFTLAASQILDAGDQADECGLYFATAAANNLDGTVDISGTTVDGSASRNLWVRNNSGTLNLTVTGGQFSNTKNNPAGLDSVGSHGIHLAADGTATITAEVGDAIFSGLEEDGLYALTSENSNATLNLTANGNSFFGYAGNPADAGRRSDNGIHLSAIATTRLRYRLEGNSFTSSVGSAILLSTEDNSSCDGWLVQNTVGTVLLGYGIDATLVADDNASTRLRVEDNTVNGASQSGIILNANDTADFDLVCIDNNIPNNPSDPTAFENLYITNGSSGSFCLDLRNNTVAKGGADAFGPGSGAEALYLRSAAGSTINLEQGSANPSDPVATVVSTNNPGIDGSFIDATGTIAIVGNASCTDPIATPTPLLAAARPASPTCERLAGLPAGLAQQAAARLGAPVPTLALSGDLAAGQLALAEGRAIELDPSAAGWGWFVDPTPEADEEFVPVRGGALRWLPLGPPSHELVARQGSAAFGRMDLLTALWHEMQHRRGEGHAESGLMAPQLPVSVRRLPDGVEPVAAAELRQAAADRLIVLRDEWLQPAYERVASLIPRMPTRGRGSGLRAVQAPAAGGNVSVTVGDLPAGRSVSVVFEATVNDPLPAGACELSVQGTVSGTGFGDVLTDDPDTGDAGDATVTPASAPVSLLPATGALTFVEGEGLKVIDDDFTVTACDPGALDGATLTVEFTSDAGADDRLGLVAGGTLTVSGNQVSHNGTVIGTFSGGGDGSTPLVITLNASADQAGLQALLRAVGYENVADDASNAPVVRFTLLDALGQTSNQPTRTITLTADNDPPTLDVNTGLTLARGDVATLTSAMLAGSDPDDGAAGLTFEVTAAPAHGELLLDGAAAGEFTQDDIDNGRVSYQHNGDNVADDSFGFRLEDPARAGVDGTFDISVTGLFGPAAQLAFTAQPADTTSGTLLAPVSVEVRDSGGNRVEDSTLAVTLAFGANPSGATLAGTLTVDAVDGTATFSNLSVDLVGSGYTLQASATGTSDATSDAFDITLGASDAGASTASVPNGSVGQPTTITVQARDAAGNPRASGGDTVTVEVSGANTASPSVTDNGDGTYTASYTPTTPGTDQVAITLNGAALGGSPFDSLVSVGASDAGASTASVPDGTVGQPTTITVQARDAEGNPRSGGGDTVSIEVTGANTATPTVTDNGDGTYTASYTPTVAGTDQVAVALNGTALGGSPFDSEVSSGSSNAGASTADVPDGTAGQPTTITVQVRDAGGNARTSGGDTVTVEVSGANTATPTVTDNGDGTYSASYTPVVAGTDQVAISLNGEALGGSPFTSVVTSAAGHPRTSTARVPNGVAGEPTSLSVQTFDAEGNAREVGGDTVVIAVSGANTATPTVTDNGDGTYTATYTPTTAGDDQVAIELNGEALADSPFTSVVAPGAASAADSTASVPNGTAGQPTQLGVQVFDAEGNARGGDTVVVEVSGANTATPSVTDNGDGTYSASYTPTVAGTDQVAITLNGAALGGSPFSSVVAPGAPDAGQSSLSVDREAAAADGSDSIVATLTVRDAHGNAIAGIDPADIVPAGTPAGLAFGPASATDEAGVSTFSLTSSTRGTFSLSATVLGVAVGEVEVRFEAFYRTSLAAGIHFVGLPFSPVDPRPEALLGALEAGQVQRWDPATGAFRAYDPASPDSFFDFGPGRGVWFRLTAPVDLEVLGEESTTTTVALPEGWSNAGNPQPGSVPWDLGSIGVSIDGSRVGTLADTALWERVRPYVWVWDGALGAHRLVFPGFGLGALPREAGFWAKATVPGVSLELAPVASASRAAQPAPSPREWRAELVARRGDETATAVVGVSATRAMGIEAPPAVSERPLRIEIVREGRRLAGELQREGRSQSWEIEVVGAGDVSLSWPSLLRSLPRGVVLELEDLSSGATRVLNTRASYAWSEAGGARRLRLTARLGHLERAEIVSLQATPTRSGGQALTLTLSGAAELTLTVRGLGGGLVSQEALGERAAGTHTLTWTGTDARGRRLPRGVYQVELQAHTANGAVTRARRTVVVE